MSGSPGSPREGFVKKPFHNFALEVLVNTNVSLYPNTAPSTLDGETTFRGMIVGLNGQTTSAQNGVYIVKKIGLNLTLVRHPRFNKSKVFRDQSFIFLIEKGTSECTIQRIGRQAATFILGTNALSFKSIPQGAFSDELVKVSSNDTTANFLFSKLTAGTNITLTEENNGANENIRITATGISGSGTDNAVAMWNGATALDDNSATNRVSTFFMSSAIDVSTKLDITKPATAGKISFEPTATGSNVNITDAISVLSFGFNATTSVTTVTTTGPTPPKLSGISVVLANNTGTPAAGELFFDSIGNQLKFRNNTTTFEVGDIANDTSPTLGGNLNVNSFSIVSVGTNDITLAPPAGRNVILSGIRYPNADGTSGQVMQTNGTGTISFATPAAGGASAGVVNTIQKAGATAGSFAAADYTETGGVLRPVSSNNIGIGVGVNTTGFTRVVAIGNSASASPGDAVALGTNASAAQSSVAIGVNSVTGGSNSTAVGDGCAVNATGAAFGRGIELNNANCYGFGSLILGTTSNQMILGSGLGFGTSRLQMNVSGIGLGIMSGVPTLTVTGGDNTNNNSVGNLGLVTQTGFGGGRGVFGIANAAVVPTGVPTGGGYMWVEAGILKYRGSSNTITNIAPA